MAKVKGLAIWINVNTGTEGSPVWTKVGGQKDASFDRGLSTIDVTDKDSEGHEEHLPGIDNWNVSFDAFLIEDNAGFLEVEAAHIARTQRQFQVKTETRLYMGKATVEALSLSGPLADAGVCSFTLKGTAGLTKT